MSKNQEPFELAVYYDENKPSSWVEAKHSTFLIASLKDEFKSIKILDSVQLEKWLYEKNIVNIDFPVVLVFSQDVVPENVYWSTNPNNSIRRFLENGGIIIWIGDIPFYWIWKQTESKQIVREQIDIGGSYSVLGVITHFLSAPKYYTKLNNEYKKILKHKWFSLRPISKERKSTILTSSSIEKIGRTENSYLFEKRYSRTSIFFKNKEEDKPLNIKVGPLELSIPKSIRLHISRMIFWVLILGLGISSFWYHLMNLHEYFASIFSLNFNQVLLITFLFTFLTLLTSLIMIYQKYVHSNEILYGAWIKHCENNGMFVRIWDYPIKDFTQTMTDDISRLINHLIKKKR